MWSNAPQRGPKWILENSGTKQMEIEISSLNVNFEISNVIY